jgi:hypothetical protein
MQSSQQKQQLSQDKLQKLADLPNLNHSMHYKQQQCVIQPSIVANILDHYLRRPQDQQNVAGTLLGSADGNRIDISTCFSVPHSIAKKEGEKDVLIIDKEYCQKMLKFQRKVNAKEGLIGFYYSGCDLEQAAVNLFTYYNQLMQEKKHKPLLRSPMLLLIDPTMQGNNLSIKVSFSV